MRKICSQPSPRPRSACASAPKAAIPARMLSFTAAGRGRPSVRIHSPDPETTRDLAASLAAAIDEEGLVVALVGSLGAGKTTFAKGLARGLGIDPDRVSSPTFVIASQYDAPAGRLFAHVDLYRLENAAELDAVGFLDLLEPGALVAVEWGDRFPGALPSDHLRVEFERATPGCAHFPDEAQRVLNALAFGPVSKAALAGWEDALSASGG